MNIRNLAALSLGGLLVSTSLSFGQAAIPPGADGSAPLTRGTGTGPDSAVTGYGESGRGGTGGSGGGPTSNGTASGAGTATGGNASGYPDRN